VVVPAAHLWYSRISSISLARRASVVRDCESR
jgi:hypothetical protein